MTAQKEQSCFLFVPDGAVGDPARLQRLFDQPVSGWIPDLHGLGADLAGKELIGLWNEMAGICLKMAVPSSGTTRLVPVPVVSPANEAQAAERFDVEWTATYWLIRHCLQLGHPQMPAKEDPLWIALDEHAETLYHARTGHWRKYGSDPYPYLWQQRQDDQSQNSTLGQG